MAPFKSVGDFIRRAPPKLKRTRHRSPHVGGGCDGFGLTRRALLWQVGLWAPPKASHRATAVAGASSSSR